MSALLSADLLERLANAEPVILPTETVYGLAARADMSAAIDAIFALKQRAADKPLALCVSGLPMAEKYAVLTPQMQSLCKAFWPGALTLIAPAREGSGLDSRVFGPGGTLGLRCPDAAWTAQIQRPLALTSANLSGQNDAPTYALARASFPDAVAGLDGGPCAQGRASTVIAFEGDRLVVLRKGAITAERIEAVL